jgi:hypothetical protein
VNYGHQKWYYSKYKCARKCECTRECGCTRECKCTRKCKYTREYISKAFVVWSLLRYNVSEGDKVGLKGIKLLFS